MNFDIVDSIQNAEKELEKVCEKPSEENIIKELINDLIADVVAAENVKQNETEMDDISTFQVSMWENFFDIKKEFELNLLETFCDRSFSKKNYLKGLKWSPCGNQLLASSNDNYMRTYNLSIDHTLTEPHLKLASKCYEGEDIHDFAWYPGSSVYDPITCCFITTSRGQPLHLWEPLNGLHKCSYRPYNKMDEMEGAVSVAFDCFGERIFCGFSNCLRIFHTDRPGRQFEERTTYSKGEGQSGLISSFAFCHSQPHAYACGSYAKTVSLCDDTTGEVVMVFSGHVGGVTHIAFSNDGNKLFSGGRKDDEILCWDLRRPGHVLKALRRNVATNQRLYFDLDPTCRYVVSGNHDGHLSIWDDLSSFEDKNNVPATLHVPAHHDTLNSVTIHPCYPILASGSGRRHFKLPVLTGDDDEDGEEEEEEEEDGPIDNSIKLWLLNKRILEQNHC